MLDELMHHVPKHWYRFHWVVWVALNFTFLAAYIISRKLPSLNLETTYGLNDAVLYMSVGILVYLLTVYWLVAKTSLALATFLGSMIMVLQFMNVFNETNQSISSIIYVIAWLLTSWIVGMHGLAISLGAMLVSFIYILLTIEFDFANIKPVSIVLAVGSIIVVVFNYFFWRHRFVTESSERIEQLSGQLKSHEQQLDILVQSITDGIIAVDTAGRITLMNAAAANLTSWSGKEAIGLDATAVLRLIRDTKTSTPVSDNEHPFNQVLLRHKPINATLQLLDRENKTIFISISISPVIVDRATRKLVGAVAVFRDVSEQKQEEQQRAEFISTASHEMRTPVAAIEGYLALALNERVSKIDNNAREYLKKAHTSTQHLGKLFQDLLTSARAEDGRLTSNPKVVEMGEFIPQVAEDLRFGAEKKGLDMELLFNTQSEAGVIDASGGLKTVQPLYYCYVDPDRVREVITNIFDNAVKYTEEGRITIGLTGNDQIVQIKISDTGAGIPKEDLPHLFQKFYRVDNSATRTAGGTGLGLFICKKIVELYNGNIWAESKQNEGSSFYINFPRLSNERANQLKNQPQTTKPQA